MAHLMSISLNNSEDILPDLLRVFFIYFGKVLLSISGKKPKTRRGSKNSRTLIGQKPRTYSNRSSEMNA